MASLVDYLLLVGVDDAQLHRRVHELYPEAEAAGADDAAKPAVDSEQLLERLTQSEWEPAVLSRYPWSDRPQFPLELQALTMVRWDCVCGSAC